MIVHRIFNNLRHGRTNFASFCATAEPILRHFAPLCATLHHFAPLCATAETNFAPFSTTAEFLNLGAEFCEIRMNFVKSGWISRNRVWWCENRVDFVWKSAFFVEFGNLSVKSDLHFWSEMLIYIDFCIHVCWLYIYMHFVRMCNYAYIHICRLQRFGNVYIYIYIYVCVYIYIYMCVCIYKHILRYTSTSTIICHRLGAGLRPAGKGPQGRCIHWGLARYTLRSHTVHIEASYCIHWGLILYTLRPHTLYTETS